MSLLLVVEDDLTIGATLESALSAAGYSVSWVRDGVAAIGQARAAPPDLVLLDLGLPDLEGLSVCRELRMLLPAAVIVVLTARREQIDVVSGLESGADDYLTKPFSLVEILARVRAHLRRSTGNNTEASPTALGALTIDISARRATINQVDVPLRAREFDLLVRLARQPGVAVSREDLMSDVWDANWFGSTKTLDVHIAALRRRLRDVASVNLPDSDPALPDIVTLRGHGYRLDLGSAGS
ncbi:response regulator transcription factor [Lacisediminihabitans sp. H27-G8]|uniref:response regulator transcription factor n=1 Tax=Lacisediminihabitans sp. H27-G8 TaxID=3111909 RepID=UPI0038FCFA90